MAESIASGCGGKTLVCGWRGRANQVRGSIIFVVSNFLFSKKASCRKTADHFTARDVDKAVKRPCITAKMGNAAMSPFSPRRFDIRTSASAHSTRR